MADAKCCTGATLLRRWIGLDWIDPDDPDYVPGKGVPDIDKLPCRLVANEFSGLCPRHEALEAAGIKDIVDR